MQKLNVVYEDNHIIVVEKIVNVSSQADKTGDINMLSIVKNYIKEKYNKPGPRSSKAPHGCPTTRFPVPVPTRWLSR